VFDGYNGGSLYSDSDSDDDRRVIHNHFTMQDEDDHGNVDLQSDESGYESSFIDDSVRGGDQAKSGSVDLVHEGDQEVIDLSSDDGNHTVDEEVDFLSD